MASIAHGRQSQPQLQRRIKQLNLGAPVLSTKNAASARSTKAVATAEVALQKKSLDQLDSITGSKLMQEMEEKAYHD